MKTFVTILGMLLVLCMVSSSAFAGAHTSPRTTQGIYGPEGLNMPGSYNGWNNPPTINAFGGIEVTGGTLLIDNTLATPRYRTLIHVASAGDITTGTYLFKFSSGPAGSPWSNAWGDGGTISANTVTHLNIGGGTANNTFTFNDNTYYSVTWADSGYNGTSFIMMATSAVPVTFPSVTQTPLAASVDTGAVTVHVTASASPSPEEIVYVRYTTDNWSTSHLTLVSFTGSNGTATIPGQAISTTVSYYVMSTTVSSPTTNFDIVTLNDNTNGGSNYSYSVPTPNPKIIASAGPHGTISPKDTITVSLHGNQLFTFTPVAGYFVDSIIVDNAYAGDSSTYNFSNVIINHTIRVVFDHNVNITFQVSMKAMFQKGLFQTGDTVSVNGTFNNWTPKVNILTNSGHDSIYTTTIALPANDPIQYQFWKSRGPTNWELSYGDDRLYSVPDTSAVIPVVFFNNQYPNINVTFQVNMSVQMLQGSFRPDSGDVIQVRGDFNSWGVPPDTLTDPNHDSIYTKTISIPAQASYGFKFWKTYRNGQDFEIIGGNLGTNRGLTLGSHDTTLPVLYYNDDSATPTTSVSYASGWNMLSIPRILLDYSKTGLFPHASSSCFEYKGSYVIKSTLQNGVGFWLKFPNDTTITYTGAPRTYDTDSLNAGWNMIGTLSSAVVAASITPNPSNAVISKYFGYSHGYKIVDTLLPGMGYWVKADTVATLFLTSSGPSAKPAAKNQSSFETFDKLTVHDAKGNEQILYLSHDNIQTAKNIYEMPPAPFSEAFDVRFSSNRFVEQVAADRNQDFPVSISGATYPVTISWETKSASSGLSIASGKQEKALSGSGSIRITSANENVHILASSSLNIPKVFALAQNYPNPFNPTTNIRFDVPEQAMVQITVYNVLGERVADLVSGVQSAGSHSLEWNATDNAGQQLASGVYFYSIKATSLTDVNKTFQSVKKMMYLR